MSAPAQTRPAAPGDGRADDNGGTGGTGGTGTDSGTGDTNGFPLPIPFLKDLGVRCTRFADGASEIVLAVESRHQNSWDMAHGGVLMTLLDVAMAMAGRAADGDGRGVVTIEMKTTFMSPGRGTLRARGNCVHRTTTMAFCEGEIVDADGRTVSRGSGTFKYVRRVPPAREPDTGADG